MRTRKPVIYMNGQETFKFAVNALTGRLKSDVIAEANLTPD